MHEHRPGHLAHRQPQRSQHLLAVAPGGALVVTETLADPAAEPAGVPAVALPCRQPGAQLVVALEHGPAPQPLGDLAGRVDDERRPAGSGDAVDPALATAAMVDAGRGEARPDRQGRHRVAGLVPGRLDGRPPGRPEAGEAAAVVTLPDPPVVHDRLVVITDDPAELGPDPRESGLLGWPHGGGRFTWAACPGAGGAGRSGGPGGAAAPTRAPARRPVRRPPRRRPARS